MSKQFPFKCLGCPIYVGRKEICYFEEMVSKIIKRINGWQGRILSYGGKVVIIKDVLQSLPLYTLSVMSPPKATLRLIDKHFARFSRVHMVMRTNFTGVQRTCSFQKKREV